MKLGFVRSGKSLPFSHAVCLSLYQSKILKFEAYFFYFGHEQTTELIVITFVTVT